LLENDQEEINTIRKSIIDDIKRLPRNLSSVKEKEEHIKTVLSEEFWQLLDYEKCEYIKEHLFEIMKHKLPEEREIVKLDLDDLVIDRKWIEFGPEGEGDYAANYKEKVEKKVLTLAETHPALKKIKNDTPISDEDLIDLEDTLNGPELFINENNLRKAFNQPYGTFIQFLKSILGKYKFPDAEELINGSFNTYVVERNNRSALSAEQIRFLRVVKNIFAQKKHIEYNNLFDPPFTQFGADAATRLFSEEELQEVIDVFNKIAV
jgi:type I restriction enzyme R subunit